MSTPGDQAAQFWLDLAGAQVRTALLVVPTVLLGFGLANLIRNTAAALGTKFQTRAYPDARLPT